MIWNSSHWQSDNHLRLDKKEADNLIKKIKSNTKEVRTKRILALQESGKTVNCINRSCVSKRKRYIVSAGSSIYVAPAE